AVIGFFLVPDPTNDAAAASGGAALYGLISGVIGILSTLTVVKLTERSIRGQSIDAGSALQSMAGKIPIAIVVGIITGILVLIGFILLILPGIWVSVVLTFALPAVALRNCGFNALAYSRELVKERWWDVFGRGIVMGICFLILFIPFIILTVLIIAPLGLAGLARLTDFVVTLISGLITYYANTVYTIMFLNFDYTRNPPAEV
ncbi:MAG: hypothetical protein AAGF24_15685, partial [Cyanobacteria bacterium P01_H01_bin.121]